MNRPIKRSGIAFLFVMVFAALFGTAAEAQQPQLQARATTQLNARSGPGTQYPVQFTIASGAIVNILACTNTYEWCQVTLNNQTGWASAQYLEAVNTNQPMTEAGPQLGPVFDFLLGVFGPQLGLPLLPPAPPTPPPPPTPGAGEICFYLDANFAGDALCVNVGASNSNLAAPWNNAISSIRIGDNAAVEVCGDPNYFGWCQIYQDDVNLTGTRNDSISSYRTSSGQPPAPPQQPGQPIQARASVTLNARSGPSTQNSVLFVIPASALMGVDQCIVGYSWCRVQYLGQTGWASATYLIAVLNNQPISATGAQLGIPTVQPPQTPPATPTPTANQVCFYLDANFGGNAFCANTGQTNLNLGSPWNNAISSIRVGANASVTVCGDPNLADWCQTYTDNVNLTSFRNDAISSYRVTAAAAPAPSRVCFFADANYAGASFCINDGQTYATLPTGWDNRITSIRVETGATVQVCRDTDFWGWCEQLTASVPQLFGDRNDAISSVRTR
jgi:uncharacterized protein YraI